MCERAREWASLRLDDELSELERVLLDAHLRRCTACAGYAEEIGELTQALRAAELEMLPQPIALPLRRRVAFASRAMGAGAAAAAVIAVTVGLGIQSGSGSSTRDLVANAVRMPESAISSGPNSEGDALLRVPRLANLKAQQGIGARQRGLRIGTS
jgi:predicted anti-sigma-YlaC factor YlaD